MRTSSAKAKGRRCAQETKDLLLKYAPELHDSDIVVTSSGDTGPDLKLSFAAQMIYPFVIENKNQEAMNIWASMDQCEGHKGGPENSHTATLFFRRNRSPLYVAMRAEDFIRLVRR
jgi:hypothetical protein